MKNYNKIIKCTLNDGVTKYTNCHIILEANRNLLNMDIELTGDLFFNTECKIEDIQKETQIKTLTDIYKYCEKHKINLSKKAIKENGLLCGGTRDYIINDELKRDNVEI